MLIYFVILHFILNIDYMYPDLSYFLHDLLGTDVDNWTSIFKTFGLFLGLAFFASAYVLHHEFKRKEAQGILVPSLQEVTQGGPIGMVEILINSLLGFFIGFKIPFIASNFAVFKEDAAGVVFSSKGNFVTGLLVGMAFLGYYLWKNKNIKTPAKKVMAQIYPHKRVGDITIVAAISGILGARLFSIGENMSSFYADPLGTLFSGSGLTIYGGLILAFIVVYIYVKKIGIPPIHVMDAVAPALIVGYGVGRLGCLFSGDGDWGIENVLAKPDWFILPDWMWSYSFPRNVLAEGIPIEGCVGKYCNQLSPGVFPTPIYEAFFCIIIFLILWALRNKLKVAGSLFFVYCFLNGIERFFIEKIRVNERYDFLGLNWSQAQWIAVGLILVGIGGFAYLNRGKKSS